MGLFPIVTFLSILTSLYLWFFLLRPKHRQPAKSAPRNYPLLGSLPDFINNRHRFLDWATDMLSSSPTNTVVIQTPGRFKPIFTGNPENLEHMLKTNFENYPKGVYFSAPFEDLFGKGIFTSDGEAWRIQRKTASYHFSTSSLRHFLHEIVNVEMKTRLTPLLENAATMFQVLQMDDVLERFAFDNICKLSCNVDPDMLRVDGTGNSPCKEVMQAFDEASALSSDRFMYALPIFYKLKKFLDIGSEKKLRLAIQTVHQFVEKIIKSRIEDNKQDEGEGEDVLSRFMRSSDSFAYLRDIVTGFLLAGRDTTSTVLTWFFWVISSHPEAEQRILEELEKIRLKYGKRLGDTYNFDEIREMHYLHAALSECMRLYPPAPLDSKTCSNDDVMPDGTFVGRGCIVTYFAYSMGRMESVWGKDWGEYKPERWLRNGIYKNESPFKYPVFHAGPRMCLGKDLAYIQMKAIVASVLERFEIDVLLAKDKCPEHVLAFTLKIKGGLPVKVKERSSLQDNCLV